MNRSEFKVGQEGILDESYAKTIIEATREPKSVREISVEHEIPLSTVYRRVYKLCDYNILQVYAGAIRDGRRCLLFKTRDRIKSNT